MQCHGMTRSTKDIVVISTSDRVGVDRHIFDTNWLLGSVLSIHFDSFHLGQCRETLVANDAPKYSVESVQMRRLVERDEELRSVRSGSLVGHRQHASSAVS